MPKKQLIPNILGKKFLTNFGSSNNDVVVMHIFDNAFNYKKSYQVDPADWYIHNTLADGTPTDKVAAATAIDLEAALTKAGYTAGKFNIQIHLLRRHLLNIPASEVSEDFKEVKLLYDDINILDQGIGFLSLYNHIYRLHQLFDSGDEGLRNYTVPLVIEETAPNITPIVNLYADRDETIGLDPEDETGLHGHEGKRVYLKLNRPLTNQGLEALNIASLCADVIEVTINLTGPERQEPFRLLRPNFDVSVDFTTGPITPKKTWDDILGSGETTSQQLISKFVSQSWGEGTELNIDYRDYKNFVHFSSAEERLRNFHYKMTLLETYRSDNAELRGLASTTPEVSGNLEINIKKINAILHGFDGYEKYMYYNSGSIHDGNISYQPATWPKANNTKPYSNLSSSNAELKTWFGSTDTSNAYFGGQIYSASMYDRDNQDMLVKSLPMFILDDSSNSTIFTYTHMIGQHYDILFNYINHMTSIHSREENPDEGTPRELLYEVAQSLGLQLFNGNVSEDLWTYALGTNQQGATLQTGLGTASGSLMSLSGKQRTEEIWNRLINNLPILLKSKGTERSIRALVNCYGIPSSILRIIEFGGPEPEGQNSHMAINRYSNALKFGGSGGLNYIHGPTLGSWGMSSSGSWSGLRPTKTVEMRIRSTYKQNQVLWSTRYGRRALLLEHSSSGHKTYQKGTSPYARLKWHVSASAADAATGGFISCSTDWAPLLDGDWWNIMVRFPNVSGSKISHWPGQPQQFDIIAKKSADLSGGRITHAISASTEVISGSEENGHLDGAWRSYTTGTDNCDNEVIGGRGFSWNSNADINIPQDIVDNWPAGYHFSGSMQEWRVWTTHLKESTFNQHVQNPNCIVGNNYSSSYHDMVQRFRMGTDLVTNPISGSSAGALTFITSSHPQRTIDFADPNKSAHYQTRHYSASVAGSTGGTFEDIEEIYYIDMPSTIGSRPLSNKIRIEENSLPTHPRPGGTIGYTWEDHSVLSREIVKERSALDRAPLDTNKLGVYLSPTNDVNIDIANVIGQTRLDDFVGDPRDYYKDKYSELDKIRIEYFKTYTSGKNLWDYIRQIENFDGSLFKIINKFIPNKANELSGLLLEPSMLERHKVSRKGKPIISGEWDTAFYKSQFEEPTVIKSREYDVTHSIDMWASSSYRLTSGEYIQYTGSINNIRKVGKGFEPSEVRVLYNFTSSNIMDYDAGSSGAPYEMAAAGTADTATRHGYDFRRNGSRYFSEQLIADGGVNKDGTYSFQLTPIWSREGLCPVITGSRRSQIYQKKDYFYSGSVSASRHNLYLNSGAWKGPFEYSRDPNTPIWIPSARLLYNGQFGNTIGSFRFQSYSSSLSTAATNLDDEAGLQKAAFVGAQLVGSDFNKPTKATPDGGPVVEFFETNPNELFSAEEATAGRGEILLSGELPLTSRPTNNMGGNVGDIIPGSQQPGPQGQTNGYWYNNGYEMVWVTASPPNTTWAGRGNTGGNNNNNNNNNMNR